MEQEYYNDFMEIDLKELIRILLRKRIIAIFFITAVTVSIRSLIYFLKPVYKAESHFAVGKEGNKAGESNLRNQIK